MLRKKILFVVLSLFLLSCITQKNDFREVCFKNFCYHVEIVETGQERAKGLMFREMLEANQGMLFIFSEEDFYPFWMKNTLIPLDIIWLDEEKKVVFISEGAEPCTREKCPLLAPLKKSLYVLELGAGEVRRMGLKEGESMIFK